jgi:hypothetical protein
MLTLARIDSRLFPLIINQQPLAVELSPTRQPVCLGLLEAGHSTPETAGMSIRAFLLGTVKLIPGKLSQQASAH